VVAKNRPNMVLLCYQSTVILYPVSLYLLYPVSCGADIFLCLFHSPPLRPKPKDAAWNGAGNGWFKGPRTLPLILALLSDKKLTAGRDISRVYLELLAQHMDGGVIEIGNEADHALGVANLRNSFDSPGL
jgi:hypothetical protein